jgi:hypothetical protein
VSALLGRSGANFFVAQSGQEKLTLLVLIVGSRPSVWGLLVWPNKEGVLGFHLAPR